MDDSKKINNNGYEYVDLGLPSGTLWGTMNVGASKPSDYGLYFQWGDTQGYTADQIGIGEGKKAFRWSDYKFSYQESSLAFTKYRIPGATLDLEDDAATSIWKVIGICQVLHRHKNFLTIQKVLGLRKMA